MDVKMEGIISQLGDLLQTPKSPATEEETAYEVLTRLTELVEVSVNIFIEGCCLHKIVIKSQSDHRKKTLAEVLRTWKTALDRGSLEGSRPVDRRWSSEDGPLAQRGGTCGEHVKLREDESTCESLTRSKTEACDNMEDRNSPEGPGIEDYSREVLGGFTVKQEQDRMETSDLTVLPGSTNTEYSGGWRSRGSRKDRGIRNSNASLMDIKTSSSYNDNLVDKSHQHPGYHAFQSGGESFTVQDRMKAPSGKHNVSEPEYDNVTSLNSDDNSDAGSEDKSDAGSDVGSDDNSDAGTNDKSDADSDGKSDSGSDDKSDAGSDGKSDADSDNNSDTDSEVDTSVTKAAKVRVRDEKPGPSLPPTALHRHLIFMEYRCFMCAFEDDKSNLFESEADLVNHMNAKHVEGTGQERRIVCPVCLEKRSRPVKTLTIVKIAATHLLRHLNSRHKWKYPEYIFTKECPVPNCKFQGIATGHMTNHLRYHQSQKLLCDLCGGLYARGRYGRHERQCPGNPDKKEDMRKMCPVCNKHVWNLKDHVASHTKVVCYICSKSLSPGTLCQHLYYIHGVNSEGREELPCSQCPYRTLWHSMLRVHVKQTHEVKINVPCPTCQKLLPEIRLANHIRTVHCEPRFDCPQCAYKGKTRSALHHHMITHSSLKEHACQWCSYKAKKKGNLTIHQQRCRNNPYKKY